MIAKMNFKDLKKITDEKLLKLANKVYELYNEGLVDEKSIHYFIREVSKRHYDIEDVNNNKYGVEYLCFEDDSFVKIVKKQSAHKFVKYSDKYRSAMPIKHIKWLNGDDKGDIYFKI